MIKYAFRIDKLKKGFGVTFNVASKGDGQKLAAMIATVSAGQGLEGKKYNTTLKSAGGKAYRVSLYRSKMRQLASKGSFLYDLFKQVRDHNEAGTTRRVR